MRVELPVVAFICVFLVLVPLPVFWRARNGTMLALIGWIVLINMIQGVNAIVWADTVAVKYPVWCDIITKIYVGSTVGYPALLICLCHYLAVIASGKGTISSAMNRHRRAMLEVFAGVVLPVIWMALHYVVQDHRFDIWEDFGCSYSIYFSLASLFIISLPQILLCFVVLIYAGIALIHFIRRRREVLSTLRRAQSDLTPSAYFRLIAHSVIQMVLAQSISIWTLIVSFEAENLQPWIGWKNIHNWHFVGQVPRVAQSKGALQVSLLLWYVPCLASVLFFAFFGCGKSARAEYTNAWRWMQGRVFQVQSSSLPVLPLSSYGRTDVAESAIGSPPVARLEDEELNAAEWDPAGSTQVASLQASPREPARVK